MTKVVNNERGLPLKVIMTRGDSGSITVSVKQNGSPYTVTSTDTVKFYLKHARMNSRGTEYIDTEPVLTKTIPYTTMVLAFDPEDTKDLDFGEYVYDIELTFANGIVDTFINNEPFIIAPEVG